MSNGMSPWEQAIAAASQPQEDASAVSQPENPVELDGDILDSYLSPEEKSSVPSEESAASEPSAQPSKIEPASVDVEEVFVKGDDGKRRALKIDYADRAALKQAVLKAQGMDLFKRQRDAERTKVKELEQFKARFEQLEALYDNGNGLKNLVSHLAGPNGLEKLVDAEIRHREYLQSLSPEEKYRMEVKSREEAWQKKQEEFEAKQQKLMSEWTERESAEKRKSDEARLHPAFDRYRMAGKLGNPKAEASMDRAIWMEAMEYLSALPDDMQITPALADKAFRNAAAVFKTHVNTQAEKKVGELVDKKKSDAVQTAKLVATQGTTGTSEKARLLNEVKGGNLKNAFKALWSGDLKI